jgi:hypothetical protein
MEKTMDNKVEKLTYAKGTAKLQKEYNELADILIPESGKAETNYGEILRCASIIYDFIVKKPTEAVSLAYEWNVIESNEATIKKYMGDANDFDKFAAMFENLDPENASFPTDGSMWTGDELADKVMDGIVKCVKENYQTEIQKNKEMAKESFTVYRNLKKILLEEEDPETKLALRAASVGNSSIKKISADIENINKQMEPLRKQREIELAHYKKVKDNPTLAPASVAKLKQNGEKINPLKLKKDQLLKQYEEAVTAAERTVGKKGLDISADEEPVLYND